MSTINTKEQATGQWESLAVEIRPSSSKNAEGTLKPFYLRRKFSLSADDRFELIIINYADPYGKVPLAELQLEGHIIWRGEHPILPGAQQVDFLADKDYQVKPMNDGFASVLNQYTSGFKPWTTGQSQSIIKKPFPPFGLAEGQVFGEYDLIYVDGNFMFWGARHIDGRGFDTEANRPANLQIPMKRIS